MTDMVNPKWQAAFDAMTARSLKINPSAKYELDQERAHARPELFDMFLAAVVERDTFTASAAKRGRNAKFPYVPVLKLNLGSIAKTQNPARGLAFATREEAIACAQKCIDDSNVRMALQMTIQRHRASREDYGFARELADVVMP